MSYNIFISYSSKDKELANKISDTMTNEDVVVFVADNSINFGESIPKNIEKAIKKCDLFVVLWSKNSKRSEWVQQEIGIVKGKQKPILPVVLNKGLELPAFIKELKFLAVYKNPFEAYQLLQNYIFLEAQSKEQKNASLVLLLLFMLIFFLDKTSSSD